MNNFQIPVEVKEVGFHFDIVGSQGSKIRDGKEDKISIPDGIISGKKRVLKTVPGV